MIRIDFIKNANGKLFMDRFSEILPKDDMHFVGNVFEAWHTSILLGTIQLIAQKNILCRKIKDVHAFVNSGQSAVKQIADLKHRYGSERLHDNTELQIVVFAYTERNIEGQKQLLEDWWGEREMQN